jgi:ribosome-binding protein aMBF1 (putative translation factor)
VNLKNISERFDANLVMEEQLMEEIEQNPEAQEKLPNVSEMLRMARERLGLSQKEVADHL